METIADVILKFLDLFDAQFADIRSKLFKILIAVGLLVVALVLAITAFVMFIYGCFLGLGLLMPPFLAAFAVALVAIILGGGLVLCAKKKIA
ncbi:Protein of unknown function (DUF1469) [Desulfitobacterium dichloroeliminans LMG P-21439]|uniref:Phage holin family protein n=1 Tax=Desulfitobacterium dichloroeliminans (strain LMG P-21439 / DCA1) TaxID=871963 RepID=L0F6S9_DESDL|nr:phage holin family protein [Desulfitobacterium dichloroeliminans]AGA68366.1 Protein of unknown function (DUF1469) [Desulfitobacterium dichloroeliminans LMG P-21439]